MGTLLGGDLHAGLSGFQLRGDIFDLGDGIVIHKTYAHLMAPFVMAFIPAPPGGHHPAPWKAASGGFSFDIIAELTIPSALERKYGSTVAIATTILFLLRLGANPAITLPVFSSYPFAELPGLEDREAKLLPFEVQPRHFPLGVVGGNVGSSEIEWVRDRWRVVLQLCVESTEFALAVEAIDSGQFIRNSALALVSLWGALEALFSPSTSELKFRVSSLIAAYLEPPGDARVQLQKSVAKLYDKRSAAAHGKPKHEGKDLLDTFNLLRRVLVAMIDHAAVPTKEELENLLFGVDSRQNNESTVFS